MKGKAMFFPLAQAVCSLQSFSLLNASDTWAKEAIVPFLQQLFVTSMPWKRANVAAFLLFCSEKVSFCVHLLSTLSWTLWPTVLETWLTLILLRPFSLQLILAYLNTMLDKPTEDTLTLVSMILTDMLAMSYRFENDLTPAKGVGSIFIKVSWSSISILTEWALFLHTLHTTASVLLRHFFLGSQVPEVFTLSNAAARQGMRANWQPRDPQRAWTWRERLARSAEELMAFPHRHLLWSFEEEWITRSIGRKHRGLILTAIVVIPLWNAGDLQNRPWFPFVSWISWLAAWFYAYSSDGDQR